MSILVVCPGCRRRFTVGDQFAGRSGPCPHCKTTIKIPKKEDQVVIHAPTEFGSGGRTAAGKLATKPIARHDARLRPAAAAALAAVAAAMLLGAWLGGRLGLFASNLVIPGIALLVVSPGIVAAGYTFLSSNEELETYRGRTLWIRSGVCAVVYVALWGGFSHVAPQVLTEELWTWLLVAPPFLIMGSLAALASLDLDFGTGFFHYCFYVFVTAVLRAAAGLGWIWHP